MITVQENCMSDHPSTSVDYGVSTTLYDRYSMEHALERIASAGVRWVEANANLAHLDPRAKPDLASIRSVCSRAGIQVRSIHLPMMGIWKRGPIAEMENSAPELLQGCLRNAAELGAAVAVLHSGCMCYGQTSEREAEGKVLARRLVDDLAGWARPLGIRIAVENELHGYTASWAESLADLVTVFPDPATGFCLDTGHAICNGQDCLHEIEAAGDRLIACHLNSNELVGDPHWLPDRGKLPWPEVKAALLAHFHGLWTLEVKAKSSPGVTPSAFEGKDAPDVVLAGIARFIRA
jgi:sugar phosphate isomerase/epimerase